MSHEAGGSLKALGEFGLIGLFAEVGRGIGDDCAVLPLSGDERLCVSTDLLLEDVHFLRGAGTPWQLGWKSLAVNLSDLAAMGARPWACLLGVCFPPDLALDWIRSFRDGLAACAQRHGCPLVGGDTVRSPAGVGLSLTVLGRARASEVLGRDGARAGDLIYVSGPLGDSAAGLHLIRHGARGLGAQERDALLGAHLQPEPQLELGRALAEQGLATALIDLSDGLIQDLGHVAAASGLGAELEVEGLPISRAAWHLAEALGRDPRDWALRGGEDYRLLFCVPPERRGAVGALAGMTGGFTPVSIGRMVGEAGIRLRRDGRWNEPASGGYDHFAVVETPAEPEERKP